MDHGWIENEATGDTVWTMNSEKRKHAGGDKRNIAIDKTIKLDAGDYVLRYITNGSHSYGSWTADRPESSLYGIVLYENED